MASSVGRGTWPGAAKPGQPGIKRGRDGELLSVNGVFNYQDACVARTLVANGKIHTRRDGMGSDGQLVGTHWAPTEVPVRNGRLDSLNLDVHGFELRQHPTSMAYEDFFEEETVLRRYYPECEALVKEVTGASSVFAFDHNMRSAGGKAEGRTIKGGAAVQGAAPIVHGDYTLTSGPRRLEQLGQRPKANDTMSKVVGDRALIPEAQQEAARLGRFSIVNLWRNIKERPVETLPLACCDASSTKAEDLCVFEIHYADRVGENYFAVHAEEHRWYYYPGMDRKEAMLIKQWDSDGAFAKGSKATFALHSAFIDPTSPEGAEDRESVEVRCMCIFGEPAPKDAC